jgi:hypothetical protein
LGAALAGVRNGVGLSWIRHSLFLHGVVFYRPQPTWLAANHSTMSENGTPSSQAIPYFT